MLPEKKVIDQCWFPEKPCLCSRTDVISAEHPKNDFDAITHEDYALNAITRNDVCVLWSRESVNTNSPNHADSAHVLTFEAVTDTDMATNTSSDAKIAVSKQAATDETSDNTHETSSSDENTTTSNHPTHITNFVTITLLRTGTNYGL